MTKSTIWISYDLGVRGDYSSLYGWFDERKAKECGESIALLTYEYSGNLLDALKLDLSRSVEITKRTRIYVIYRDRATTKIKGYFLFGGRRTPPWAGVSGSNEEDEDIES